MVLQAKGKPFGSPIYPVLNLGPKNDKQLSQVSDWRFQTLQKQELLDKESRLVCGMVISAGIDRVREVDVWPLSDHTRSLSQG